LKKRSKKLLLLRSRYLCVPRRHVALDPTDKSFLLLFFKKEDLPSFELSECNNGERMGAGWRGAGPD
jgi:hypothetical protein